MVLGKGPMKGNCSQPRTLTIDRNFRSTASLIQGVIYLGTSRTGQTSQRRHIAKYAGESWTLTFSLAPAPGMENQSTIVGHVYSGVRSTKKSIPNTPPRHTCSWRRGQTTLLKLSRTETLGGGWERTVGFSFGKCFSEIDTGFSNQGGIPCVIGKTGDLHELSACDCRRTFGVLGRQRRRGTVFISWTTKPVFDLFKERES